MNASEYEKLEKIMNDGLSSARQANKKFEEVSIESDWDKKNELRLLAQNHLGYAEGIKKVLTAINFKHDNMKILEAEINK